MSNVKWKTYLIAGLIVFFGNPLFIVVIAILFPNCPAALGMLLLQLPECAGAILLALALAKRRMENGTSRAKTVFRALTITQILFITAMLLITVGTTLETFHIESVGHALQSIGGLCMLVAFYLFVGKVFGRVRRRTHPVPLPRQTPVPKPAVKPPTAQPAPEPADRCAQCGKTVERSELAVWNGKPLCRDCLRKENGEENVPQPREKTVCCVCKQELDQREMILVDDAFFCEKCFRSRY